MSDETATLKILPTPAKLYASRGTLATKTRQLTAAQRKGHKTKSPGSRRLHISHTLLVPFLDRRGQADTRYLSDLAGLHHFESTGPWPLNTQHAYHVALRYPKYGLNILKGSRVLLINE